MLWKGYAPSWQTCNTAQIRPGQAPQMASFRLSRLCTLLDWQITFGLSLNCMSCLKAFYGFATLCFECSHPSFKYALSVRAINALLYMHVIISGSCDVIGCHTSLQADPVCTTSMSPYNTTQDWKGQEDPYVYMYWFIPQLLLQCHDTLPVMYNNNSWENALYYFSRASHVFHRQLFAAICHRYLLDRFAVVVLMLSDIDQKHKGFRISVLSWSVWQVCKLYSWY